jgi:flagellar hook-associated protein 1 FlgK
MSLFGSIQLAGNTLQAQQIGLQVVGQNIANSNTPGYSREDVTLTPAPTQQLGSLLLGTGVQVQGITQKVDEFLEQRLRAASSDTASSQAQTDAYSQLESILGALKDTDLNSTLNKFFSSISDVLNQPQDAGTRNLAVLQAQTVTGYVNGLANQTKNVQADVNNRIAGMATQINQLVEQVRTLNVQIVATEGGTTSHTQAVGLRDKRNLALSNLSQLVDIKVQEQPSGADNVFVGGDYLVFEGTSRQVQTVYTSDQGFQKAAVQIAGSQAPLGGGSGQLSGLLVARDQILGGFLDSLNKFSGTLANEFNKVFSSGQGLTGYQTLTSTNAVTNANQPLDAAGLPFTPVHGSFQVLMRNTQTGLTTTTDIPINLNGLGDQETTLTSLVSSLNGVNGLQASITPSGNLSLATTSPNTEFSFANDTTGTLAALGVNTLFTGSTAATLGVNQVMLNDPGKFAASSTGIGGGTDNAVLLAGFGDQPLDSQNGNSINVLQTKLTADVTQGSAVAQSIGDGFQTFQDALTAQQTATSGVSIDEEAVKMISYQRTYQASAKYIATLNDLLNTLVQL